MSHIVLIHGHVCPLLLASLGLTLSESQPHPQCHSDAPSREKEQKNEARKFPQSPCPHLKNGFNNSSLTGWGRSHHPHRVIRSHQGSDALREHDRLFAKTPVSFPMLPLYPGPLQCDIPCELTSPPTEMLSSFFPIPKIQYDLMTHSGQENVQKQLCATSSHRLQDTVYLDPVTFTRGRPGLAT